MHCDVKKSKEKCTDFCHFTSTKSYLSLHAIIVECNCFENKVNYKNTGPILFGLDKS